MQKIMYHIAKKKKKLICKKMINVLISTGPQRQTNAKGCWIFGDLDQLKSKDTMQKKKTVNRADPQGEERKRNKTAVKLKQVPFLSSPWGSVYRFLHS